MLLKLSNFLNHFDLISLRPNVSKNEILKVLNLVILFGEQYFKVRKSIHEGLEQFCDVLLLFFSFLELLYNFAGALFLITI